MFDPTVEAKSADTIVDEAIDKFSGQETPAESSPAEKPQEEASEAKAPEDTTSKKSAEAKAEEDIPKEFHKNPAWQRILKERDAARQQLEETQKQAIPKEQLELFHKTVSSPEFIRHSMKAQGYSDDKINEVLSQVPGYKSEPKPADDLGYVLNKLGVDMSQLSQEQKDYVNVNVADMVKVASALIDERLSKQLPGQVKPLEDRLNVVASRIESEDLLKNFTQTISEEGILDFKKDIEPELHKWIDENPKGNRQALAEYFRELNHRLSIERLRTKEKKSERDDKKVELRSAREGSKTVIGKIERKKDQSDDSFVDEVLNAHGL